MRVVAADHRVLRGAEYVEPRAAHVCERVARDQAVARAVDTHLEWDGRALTALDEIGWNVPGLPLEIKPNRWFCALSLSSARRERGTQGARREPFRDSFCGARWHV